MITVVLTPAQLDALVSACDRALGRCGATCTDDDLAGAYEALCDAGEYLSVEATAGEVQRMIHGRSRP